MSDSTLQYWFEAALAQPEAERATWLSAHCANPDLRAQVLALLHADARLDGDVLDTPALELVQRIAVESEEVDSERLIGSRVGPFRLLRMIGQGGMAVVFLAEREGADFSQQVAVKLLQRGLFSALEQRLFRRERQALALLSHPNIAQLIDGGVSADGVAYLAMEYIDGVPLTEHCRNLGLGLQARLRLFATVCRAVDAAHRALVVHRDIKPGNILVTHDGTVKLLDFGIAKLLQSEREFSTQTQLAPLTPEYAAPEQFDGRPITTATDVYALGVLLQELLTGERPSRDSDTWPSQAVGSAEAATLPIPLVQLRRQLRGDLDNIIVKARDAEPERRYSNAGALADDIDRHLHGQPVQAHPPSGWYRTRKFVQRHRGSVAVSALLLIGILVSLIIAVWQTDLARKEAARANAVRDFLVGALDAGRARLPRDQRPTLADLVAAAASRIDGDQSLDPQTRAELLTTLAEVSWSTADSAAAIPLYERAIAERIALNGIDDDRAGSIRSRFVQMLVDGGQYERAKAQLDATPAAVFERHNEAAVELGLTRLIVDFSSGEIEQALADIPRVLALAEQVFPADSKHLLEVQMSVGGIFAASRSYTEAVRVLAPALETWHARKLDETELVATSTANLALALTGTGDKEGGIVRGREALALRQRIYPEGHPDIANSMSNLAVALAGVGELSESRALQTQALAIRRHHYGDDSPKLLSSIAGLSQVERTEHNLDAALAHMLEAKRICLIGINIQHPNCIRMLHGVAYALYLVDRFDEAELQAQQALELFRRTGGDDHPDTAGAWSLLATIAAGAGKFAVGLERSDTALRLMEANPNTGAEALQLARYQRAENLIGIGRHQEAAQLLTGVISEWSRINSATHFRLVAFLAMRARAELGLQDRVAARATAKQALALGIEAKLIKPETLEFLVETAAD